jgi:GPH family glycoside/pentoside/hexuronide:cation symporter
LASRRLALLGVLFGYVSGEDPGPDPANAFRFLISVFPFVCLVLAWTLARKLCLEDNQKVEKSQ